MPHLPNQSTDQAIEAIFGPVLKGPKSFNFFSYCLCARAPSLGMRMREMAGKRIAEKLGEQLPPWVKEDITALHLYASRLGGVAVHKKVEIARAARGNGFYEEVAEAVGALLEGEMLIFAEYSSEARALAGWSVGGMRGGTPAALGLGLGFG